jgi:urease accessory protein
MIDRLFARAAVPGGIAAALLATLPAPALAHTGVHATEGFLHGLLHPLTGGDHLLAMVAVGLWASQRGGRHLWVLPVTFVGVMLAGGALARAGLALPWVEGGILLSILVMGARVALAARAPLAAGATLVGVFALFHGFAHGAEMPGAVSGLTYAAGFASATALLHSGGILFARVTARPGAVVGLGWVRVAGAATALAGLVLWMA